MSYEEVIFYFVAALTVLGALGCVLGRNVVHSALFLILALLAVAGVFILLAAAFLAIVGVLIYGGAVTILVLFAMMLTRVRDVPAALDGPQRPFAALAAGVFMGVSIFSVVSTEWPGESEKINVISIEEIGNALFTTWSVPFEVASLVLMSVELMLQAVSINFIAFAVYLSPEAFTGLIFAVFVITIAAAEVGLALAIILRLYRNKATANVDEVDTLKW